MSRDASSVMVPAVVVVPHVMVPAVKVPMMMGAMVVVAGTEEQCDDN